MAGTAMAEMPPLGGQVFNLERNERIHYSCQNVTETDIECEFTRATVSLVLPDDKVEAKRAETIALMNGPGVVEEFLAGSCEIIANLEEAATDNVADDDMDFMAPDDREAMLSLFRDACTKQDRASAEAYMELGLSIENRTCMVSTYGWKGRFSKNDEKTWVRTDKDGPVGDGCGGLYLDRFELSDTGTFWDLVKLEVASNPNGKFSVTGEQCSDVYTGEEVKYRWQGANLQAGCDYIRLNLFD